MAETAPTVPATPETPGGPVLCDACVSGGVIPGAPKGITAELAGLKYYLAEGNGDAKQKAIVLSTDLFGLGIPNPSIMADEIAEKTGFSVYVPDFLQGDYPPRDKITTIDTPINGLPFFRRISIFLGSLWTILRFLGPSWLYRHRNAVSLPLLENFGAALKAEKGVTDIGVVGYCFGGQLAALLAASETFAPRAAVVAHPAPLTVANFAAIKCPFALILAQEDFALDSIVPQARAALEALKKPDGTKLETAVYQHPGTTHGFAARPDFRDPVRETAYRKALEETIDWFKLYL